MGCGVGGSFPRYADGVVLLPPAVAAAVAGVSRIRPLLRPLPVLRRAQYSCERQFLRWRADNALSWSSLATPLPPEGGVAPRTGEVVVWAAGAPPAAW